MYTKILVLMDGSEFAECVLPYVEWFARVSDINELIFLRVVEPFHVSGGLEGNIIPEERHHIENDAVRLAREYLEKISAPLMSDKYIVKNVVPVGKPAKTIVEYVSKSDINLIIMATHGHSGFHRWVSGSVADEIINAAHLPVMLIHPGDKMPD